jgi:hypothetical protein
MATNQVITEWKIRNEHRQQVVLSVGHGFKPGHMFMEIKGPLGGERGGIYLSPAKCLELAEDLRNAASEAKGRE